MTSPNEPVHLIEQEGTNERFLIYADGRGIRVELRYEGDALWMTQAQMAELFGRDVSVMSRHIANILEEEELSEETSLQKLQTSPFGRPGTLYSLDMVISVGYRVSSAQATVFRRWATSVLVRFATSGFVVDVERLKGAGQHDRIAELRDIIRDIRSSEANVYAELRRICSMCQDYDPKSEAAREFYQQTQAKLFYAVVNQTPSEILIGRADGSHETMGLHIWPKAGIRKADAVTAKNYLAPGEIRELNRLTSILLDIFEDQLEIGRLTTMGEARQRLDDSLRNVGRVVLAHGGQVAAPRAKAAAERAYETFDERRRLARQVDAADELAALRTAANVLPKNGSKQR